MKALRDSVYILVAVGSLALAACQPSESGLEPSSQAVDHAVALVSNAMSTSTEHASR